MDILLIPNDSLEAYNKKWLNIGIPPHLYFDPNGKINNIYFLYKWEKSYSINNKKFSYFSFLSRNRLVNIFKYLISWIKILKKHPNIKIIRTYNPHIEWLITIILWKMFWKKTVISLHNDFEYERKVMKERKFFNFFQKVLEWISYKYCNKIIIVSSYLRKYLLLKWVNKNKINLILNSFDFKTYTLNNLLIDKLKKEIDLNWFKVFITIWRLNKQKNQKSLLLAFSNLIKDWKKCKLLIIGSWELKESLIRIIKEKNIEKYVYFLGNVDNKDIINYLKISNYFVLPSFYEGFWKVLVEAQLAKLPILCSDIPTVKDIVNEKNTILFDPHNIDDIKNKMLFAYENEESLNTSYDVDKFNYTICAEQEYKLYKNLIW